MAKAKTLAQTRQNAPRTTNAPAPVVAHPPAPSPPLAPLSRFTSLPEGRNPNRHTERGLRMLEDAIQQDGYVAPMTAAADGTILDGNARLETVAHALPADPIIVEHDGTRPIVAVRTDIPSADDPRAQRIIVGANRIAEADLDWDAEVLKRMQGEGVDLSGLWDEYELKYAVGAFPELTLDTEAGESAEKGLKSLVLLLTASQHEQVTDRLKALASEHGDGDSPNIISNAATWAILHATV